MTYTIRFHGTDVSSATYDTREQAEAALQRELTSEWSLGPSCYIYETTSSASVPTHPIDGTTFTREDGSTGVWLNGLPRTIDAVVTSDDWARDRAAIEREGWDELPREDDEEETMTVCQACATYPDSTRNYCQECGRAIPGIVDPMAELNKRDAIERASRIVARLRIRALGIATGALLALTLSSTHAAPAGCTPNGSTGEGFPVVSCADGDYYLDMDGRTNADGSVAYCPGVVWVPMA